MENHTIQSESATLKISLRFIILTISQLILYISLVLGQDTSSFQTKSAHTPPFRAFEATQPNTSPQCDVHSLVSPISTNHVSNDLNY